MIGDTPRIILTSGEPAGIGPDICLMAAQRAWPAQLVVIGNRDLFAERANTLGIEVELLDYDPKENARPSTAGKLQLVDLPLEAAVVAGQLNPKNAPYVLAMLDLALELVSVKEADAIVTAPVQKSVINDAGVPFSGHTEFFAEGTNTNQVVMMLAAGALRVALATTHLPLRDVADAVTPALLTSVLGILNRELVEKYKIERPRISVLGLNPHAGEGGHLGMEEINTITPVIEAAQKSGMPISGPLPADTAFSPELLAQTDAYLAMYHDQGLPVLKYAGFGEAVNVTLGLPLIRTSVDHGTALSLAGTGSAKPGSLFTAIFEAIFCLTGENHV